MAEVAGSIPVGPTKTFSGFCSPVRAPGSVCQRTELPCPFVYGGFGLLEAAVSFSAAWAQTNGEPSMNNQKPAGTGKNQSHGNTNTDVSRDDQWKTKVNGAKQQWSKLQQEELLATAGNNDQLSSLVQKRYSMSKADADKQVEAFFSKH
jgi:uncharacterized protein YjbJ (UPF0337 family)